jgi:hypothetical protein
LASFKIDGTNIVADLDFTFDPQLHKKVGQVSSLLDFDLTFTLIGNRTPSSIWRNFARKHTAILRLLYNLKGSRHIIMKFLNIVPKKKKEKRRKKERKKERKANIGQSDMKLSHLVLPYSRVVWCRL